MKQRNLLKIVSLPNTNNATLYSKQEPLNCKKTKELLVSKDKVLRNPARYLAPFNCGAQTITLSSGWLKALNIHS